MDIMIAFCAGVVVIVCSMFVVSAWADNVETTYKQNPNCHIWRQPNTVDWSITNCVIGVPDPKHSK